MHSSQAKSQWGRMILAELIHPMRERKESQTRQIHRSIHRIWRVPSPKCIRKHLDTHWIRFSECFPQYTSQLQRWTGVTLKICKTFNIWAIWTRPEGCALGSSKSDTSYIKFGGFPKQRKYKRKASNSVCVGSNETIFLNFTLQHPGRLYPRCWAWGRFAWTCLRLLTWYHVCSHQAQI